MEFIVIPVPVPSKTQRTIKLVGRGLKSLLTTKVSGKLVIRKKKSIEEIPSVTTTPAAPPLEEDDGGRPPILATVWPEDIHHNLVSRGIKVRDFAYPVGRVGHREPTHPHPLVTVPVARKENKETTAAEADESTKEAEGSTKEAEGSTNAKDTDESEEHHGPPARVESTPMPRISTSWELPHPLLRPIATYPRPPYPPDHIPTPKDHPIYETHRIPGHFSPILGVIEVEARLGQDPRTVPILGITTRRLLTVSPDLVDLSRYHEMDLEELRRYDRRMLFQIMNGVEPPPWRCFPLDWAPSAENRELMGKFEGLVQSFRNFDKHVQRAIIVNAHHKMLEDDVWMQEQMDLKAKENLADGLMDPENPLLKELHEYDRPTDGSSGLTPRQWLELWERRLDTALTYSSYSTIFQQIKRLWRHDGRNPQNDDDISRHILRQFCYLGVAPPFVLGQTETQLPLTTYWGHDAVWDDYRVDAAHRVSDFTLTEHIEHLTGKTVAEAEAADSNLPPWPVPVTETDARYHEGPMSGTSVYDFYHLSVDMFKDFLAGLEGRELEPLDLAILEGRDLDAESETGSIEGGDALESGSAAVVVKSPSQSKRKRSEEEDQDKAAEQDAGNSTRASPKRAKLVQAAEVVVLEASSSSPSQKRKLEEEPEEPEEEPDPVERETTAPKKKKKRARRA
ncbi:hypothetical protein C8F01DRAFT_1375737 [Mycena amicta]|nr:hypothetical protein C8F01DRAFT_1179688 [Mycena amicta]KAJ7052659.1 hypothetical protein C8F01DRAFT_1375737 [Mycena amicta]